MMAAKEFTSSNLKQPIHIAGREFASHKYAYYKWLREEAPVCKARISVFPVYLVSRYDDCVDLVRDPRFVRNRTTATGGSRMPVPMPKSAALLSKSMILEDEPEHRRLRGLVQKAFSPRALARLEPRIEQLTHDLLDRAEQQGRVDLMQSYSLPIPVTVISEMVGVSDEDMPRFKNSMKVLSDGPSGWTLLRTFMWDLRRVSRFLRELIAKKRSHPEDDILTELIHAEEAGDRLSEDELLAMVFLLIIAGYETTVHLITNGVLALLQHPHQLARLRAEPTMMDSAVEEILRYAGPVHGSKQAYALADVTLHGVKIQKGAAVFPVFGAANRDPEAFENPDVFDIARTPNKHLAFGHGIHFCLGATLARMETRIAFKNLLERNPNLRLAVAPEELRLQHIPMWHRYQSLPVVLR